MRIDSVITAVLVLLMFGISSFALCRAATTKLFGPRERAIWVVFIALTNVLGAFVFLLALGVMRKYQRKTAQKTAPVKQPDETP